MASLLLCLIVISIVMIPGYGHLRAEYALAAVGFGIALAGGRISRIRLVGVEAGLLLAMFVSGLLSLAVYTVMEGGGGSGLAQRDVFSVVRFLTYAAFLMVGAALSPSDARGIRQLGATFAGLALVGCVLSVLQYFDVLGINLALARIYAPSNLALGSFDSLLAGGETRRVSGTLGNPNLWGWWLLTLALFLYCWGASRRIARALPILLALSVALLLTGSRTGLVSLLLGLAAATGAISWAWGRSSTRAARGVLIIGLMLGSGWLGMQTLYEAQDRYSISQLDSLYARFRVWQSGFERFKEHPILGTGPRKGELLLETSDTRRVAYLDNAYLAMLTRFGVVGLALYLAFLVSVMRRSLRAARSSPPAVRWWPAASFAAWVACAVFGFAADTMFAVQMMLLLCLSQGIAIGVQAGQPSALPQRARPQWATVAEPPLEPTR